MTSSPHSPPAGGARPEMERRRDAAAREADTAGRLAARLSSVRLGYVAAVVLLLAATDAWSWPAGIVAVALFVPLAVAHRRAERRALHARGLASACRASLARMARDWAAIPPARVPEPDARPMNAAAARDLDILGEVSLFRLLDVGLALGGACTVRWLLGDPAPLAVIQDRQAAVASLRDRTDFLLETARISRFGGGRRPPPTAGQMAAFRAWCAEPARPLPRAVMLLARILTAVVLASVIVGTTVPRWREHAILAASIAVPAQLAVAVFARRHLRARLGAAADTLARLGDVVAVMRAIVAEPPAAGRMREIQELLSHEHAVDAFAALERLLDWDAIRYSPLMHFAANGAIGFDAHLADRFDRWHAAHGRVLPEWLDLVGEAQALTALATLAHENPGWELPSVHDDRGPMVTAGHCGHPLLPAEVRVVNPVALTEPGETLVLTGSNMSGKTTYLRAVGLNALLGLAGGPVCATAMTLRRCRVRTSVRVEDDLSRGSSLFFAEVSRISDIVRDAEAAGSPPVLFLLDEILHGTNAGDRREATRLVLERLTASGSAGIITTHDPAVGEWRDERGDGGRVRNAHFTDSVTEVNGDVRMTFDYTLRDGPARTTNALRILELLGLSSHRTQ